MAKVLIIEDESSLMEVYSEILESEGHKVFKAMDGDEGLNLALQEDWKVMFLDIMLPGMDGITLLTRLSDEGKLTDRNVIVLSNLDNPSVVDECIRLGASEHLNKAEVTPDVVVNTVAKYVTKE